MKLLLDTDIVIDYLRGSHTADIRHAFTTHICILSAISYAELLTGIHDRHSSAQYESLKGLLQHYNISIAPIDVPIIEKYIDLKQDLRKKPIGDFDTFIAATALTHDASLYTRNVKHFTAIPSLQLYQP